MSRSERPVCLWLKLRERKRVESGPSGTDGLVSILETAEDERHGLCKVAHFWDRAVFDGALATSERS